MFATDPILVDDIKFYRGKRGHQPLEAVLSAAHRAITAAVPHAQEHDREAWVNLLTKAAEVSSGNRPDAVWADGDARDSVLLCRDGFPASARRGLMGLTAAQFAHYHLQRTTTDIHNMFANTAALIHMVCRTQLISPTDVDAVLSVSGRVLGMVRHGDEVRGFRS